MTSKHMKRSSTCCFQGNADRTAVRCPSRPCGRLSQTDGSQRLEVWRNRTTHTTLAGCRMGRPSGGRSAGSSVGPSHSTPRCLPKRSETWVHTEICTQMFTAAGFIVARTWRQRRCPATEEQRNRTWSANPLEYYSAVNRNGALTPAPTCTSLEDMLSERSQT